jgi:hypothetical protein
MTRIAKPMAAILGVALLLGGTVRADEQPQVSHGTAKFLKAAQEAMQAKNWAEVIAKTKEAAQVGERNAYDDFVINSLQMVAYTNMQQYAETATAIEKVVDSPYQQAANKPMLLRTLASIDYQQKDYEGAIKYGQRAQAAGDTSEDTALTIAQANYLSNNYKEALTALDAMVARDEQAGHKPKEQTLNLLWSSAIKAKDDAAAARAVEKLIVSYPKPDYWANAIVGVQQQLGSADDRLKLMSFRLMRQVGLLKQPAHFTEMAQIALDQGNPGEAQAILEQAFGKNLFTEQRDKERNQRLLDKVKEAAGRDRSELPRSEKDANAAPTGDALVQVGAAYLGFGEPDKAIAAINAGIAKGKLKYQDEAYMLLGMAYDRSKNSSEAVKAFGKANSDPKYARLAKLWVLDAKS